MLVRNRVRDYGRWREIFDDNLADAEAAGLTLEGLWQAVDDPNNVFFLLRVADRGRAQAFLEAPESAPSPVRAPACSTASTTTSPVEAQSSRYTSR